MCDIPSIRPDTPLIAPSSRTSSRQLTVARVAAAAFACITAAWAAIHITILRGLRVINLVGPQTISDLKETTTAFLQTHEGVAHLLYLQCFSGYARNRPRFKRPEITDAEFSDIKRAFNGGSSAMSVINLQMYVRRFMEDHPEDREQLALLDQQLENMLPLLLARSLQLQNGANELLTLVRRLPVGGSQIIPLIVSNHAVTLTISKNSDGTFKAVLFNTGIASREGGREATRETVYPEGRDKMSQEELESFLTDYAKISPTTPDSNDIYQLYTNLKKRGVQIPRSSLEPYKTQGEIGNCSSKALSVAVKRFLGQDLHQRLKVFMLEEELKVLNSTTPRDLPSTWGEPQSAPPSSIKVVRYLASQNAKISTELYKKAIALIKKEVAISKTKLLPDVGERASP